MTPLGVGARTLHERWSAGVSGIEDGFGRADEFEPKEHLSVKEVRRADRFTQFALAAAARGDRGRRLGRRPARRPGPRRVPDRHRHRRHRHARAAAPDPAASRAPTAISPLSIPLLMANAASGVVSMKHGLRGQSFGTVSACSAGAHAIGMAARLIRYGDAETRRDRRHRGRASRRSPPPPSRRMDALSDRGISRPSTSAATASCSARARACWCSRRSRRPASAARASSGCVRGYASTSDAHHLTAPEPSGRGASKAIELALQDAELSPEDVRYVNAHGTSTPLNDRAETKAIKAALGEERARTVPVSSTKSAIGHLLGAAGAVEAIATLLALRDRIAPPTLNYEEPDEGLDLDYVPQEARPLANGDGRAIGISNAFGFGGHNAVLCLEAA